MLTQCSRTASSDGLSSRLSPFARPAGVRCSIASPHVVVHSAVLKAAARACSASRAARQLRERCGVESERRRGDGRVGAGSEARSASSAGAPGLARRLHSVRTESVLLVGVPCARNSRAVGEAVRADEPVEARGAGGRVERRAYAVDEQAADGSAGQRQRHRDGHADALGLGVIDEPAQRLVDRRQVLVADLQAR